MKIDSISNTFKENNEDRYGITKYAYWLIDGASALNKNNYTNKDNDVVWVVEWWEKYLNMHLDQLNKNLKTILEEGIISLNNDISQFVDIETISNLDQVSSAIALVRVNMDTIECFVLGDVDILVQDTNGDTLVLTDETIIYLDEQVMKLITNNPNRDDNIEFNNYTNEELQLLRHNRMTMNTQEGYAILAHDKNAIQKGIYKEYDKYDINNILIVSDGYSCIYNKYYYCTQEEIIQLCQSKGLGKVLGIIRDIENDDKTMVCHPRLRFHDDATAVLIEDINN